MNFEHQRHKPVSPLTRPREIIVACVPMRSNVNVSQIARTASASGVQRLIICGNAKLNKTIARDGAEQLQVEVHRTLLPSLKRFKEEGYVLIGLEQTTHSENIYHYQFPRRCVLVVGNERLGLQEDVLAVLHATIEIPVYGLPHSYNAAMATGMALYEYCRQYPEG